MVVGIFLLILFFITILFKFVYIKINIQTTRSSNSNDKRETKITFGIYLFNKIPIIKNKLGNGIFEKNSKFRRKIDKLIDVKEFRGIPDFRILRKAKLHFEKFNLNLDFGTGDILLTTYLVPIISTVIAIVLNQVNIKINNKETYYRVNPLFDTNNFSYKISFNGIISINLAHIIFTAIMLNNSREKKESDNFGKSSNRKPNANCNV